MKIKIAPENAKRLEAKLVEVNGQAYTYTLSCFDELASLAKSAEEQLERSRLPKALRSRAQVTYSPSGPGKAYYRHAFSINTTEVVMVRGSRDWFLVSAKRFRKRADKGENWVIAVSERQAEAIRIYAMTDYEVAA